MPSPIAAVPLSLTVDIEGDLATAGVGGQRALRGVDTAPVHGASPHDAGLLGLRPRRPHQHPATGANGTVSNGECQTRGYVKLWQIESDRQLAMIRALKSAQS